MVFHISYVLIFYFLIVKAVLLIVAIVSFNFICFYSQDFISSTLERLSEFMPSTMEEINTRSQHVFIMDDVPYVTILQFWNYYMLHTFTMIPLNEHPFPMIKSKMVTTIN